MKLGIEVSGINKVLKRLQKIESDVSKEMEKEQAIAAEGLKDLAQARAPVRTGRLRESAFVDPPYVRNGAVTVEVGFGAPYAAAVHEGTGPNRQFLLQAIADNPELLQQAVARVVERVL